MGACGGGTRRGLTHAALTELAGLLMATSSFEDLMQAVADLAGRAVPAASTCGITLAEDGHVITVASADALARARTLPAVTPLTCGDDGSPLPAGVLAESLRAALSARSTNESLQVVIALASDIGPCDQASITELGPGPTVRTIASSDDRAAKADLWQYQLGEGPTWDAVRSDEMIMVEDLPTDRRWPRWAPLAEGFGIGGVIAVPLYTDTILGVINLYSELPREYDDLDLEAVKVIAAHASVVLAHTRTTEHLKRAIDTRTLIGQAQGMLMARHGLTPNTAFAALRRYSQNTNTRITATAEQLVSTGRLPGLKRQINAIKVNE